MKNDKEIYMADEVINFRKVRTGSKDIVMPNNEVNQTLTLSNNSQYEISNIYIKDTISDGITFKALSVYVDGASYPDFDPTQGFTLPHSIIASSSATITYRIIVDSDPPKEMILFSEVSYEANGVTYENEKSNTYKIELASGEIVLTKTASKSSVIKGQVITYQNVIENVGNVTQTSVVFKDTIPPETEFVSDSVKVNGTAKAGANPVDGFSVGNIYAKEKTTVTFDVKIK